LDARIGFDELEFKSVSFIRLAELLKKKLNSYLFWLNSHPGRACLVLRACRSAVFLDHDAKKGCEFNQKRCELKNFQDLKLSSRGVFSNGI
jgi:hypothetical protein